MVPAAMAEDLAGSGGFSAGFTYNANPLAVRSRVRPCWTNWSSGT